MYIPPLLLLVPEFAADYVEENNQLFDMICLRKYEKLDDVVNLIVVNYVYTYGDSCGSGGSRDGSRNGWGSWGDGRYLGSGDCCGDGYGWGFDYGISLYGISLCYGEVRIKGCGYGGGDGKGSGKGLRF